MNKPAHNKGFTLVELAVSLVVIGLLIGLGTAMVGPLMTAIKVRETKESIGGAVESVNSWASGNNRLPPFTPTAPDTVKFIDTVKSPNDSWGREFIYLYDTNLAPTGVNTATKDTICGRRSTNISLRNCLTLKCDGVGGVLGTDYVDISNISYAIFSNGDEPQTVTADTFITLDGATTNSTSLATPPNPRLIKIPFNTDDIVRWVTLDELRTKVGCQGAQLRIVNNELPFTNYSASYGPINIIADGGIQTGNYEWKVKLPPPPATKPLGIKFNNQLLTFTNTSTSGWFTGTGSSPLVMQGYPRPTGSYNYTFSVRDSQGNASIKPFVLTISP